MGIALALGLLLAGGHAAAPSCADQGKPWIELEVYASELMEHGPSRRVLVHDSGCAEITFGPFDIRAGTRVVELDSAEMARLARLLADSGVRHFDARAVRTEVNQVQQLRAQLSPGSTDAYTVACADVHKLVVNESGSEHVATWHGLMPYAQQYREVAALQGFARLAAELESLGTETRAAAQQGTP